MYKPVAFTLLFILSFIQTGFAADDLEHLVVSNDKTKWQQGVSAAMAPNGDVLVVWSEETDPSQTSFRVVAVLCKLGGNGRYSVGTPKSITSSLDSYFSPGVAHNQKRGTWTIVWSRREEPHFLGTGLEIHGVELNAAGGIQSSSKEIFANGSGQNVLPYIHWIGKGSNAGGYLLLWTARRPQSGSTAGVYSMPLNGDLEPVGNSSRLFSAPHDPDEISFFYPGMTTDVEQNINGEFLVGLITQKQGDPFEVLGHIVRLNQRGQFIARTRIGLDGDIFPVRLIRLKKQLFVASFWTANTSSISFWNRRYLGNLKPKGAAYPLLPSRTETLGDIVKLENDKGAYSVVVSKGQIWGQYIRKNGKVKAKDDPELIMTGANKAIDVFFTFCLPGTNRVFLLWQHKFKPDEREVRALIFDPQLN